MALVTPDSGAPRIFASPLARRLAKEAGLDLSAVTGSGPHGRVIERDVKGALAGGGARKPAPAAEARPVALAEGPSAATTRKFYEPGSFDEVPHDSMRKAIARRLTESIQSVPHFYLDVDCEIDALLKVREDFNAAAPKRADGAPEWKTSVNDYVVKALALALQRVPEANVTYTPESMLKHKASDIGVAVAIPGGLITPIIRNAQAKTVREISEEVKELAARARERKLKPQEYEGGVSAVSNLGMYGIKNFSAVINPPQSTILAVGKGEPRMVVKNGAPVAANIMSVTLSCDHRAVDGALGAELLAAFKQLIEQPMGLFA
ncbi:2-oxo acid dehydrogenase subunit E2 [Methylocystis echinoides]|uniref:2-oxo acid dehydrogenase subunit E2 n=1 Tax=Methylocystis echinoides TaxID=29468 RepID=UPI003428B370